MRSPPAIRSAAAGAVTKEVPRAVTMEAAWAAFEEFVQVPVDGIEGPEDDGDGFIVEWGLWDWTGNRPALTLGRLLAVNEDGDRQDPYWQPQYWKVEFQSCFAEDPAWADLHISGGGDSGFDHAAIGGPRAEALAGTRRFIEQDPLLSVMWRSALIDIEVTLDRAGQTACGSPVRPDEDPCEVESSEVDGRGFVVSGGQTSPLLELVDAPLGGVALLVVRCINRLKWRGIAMRTDRLAVPYLVALPVAAIFFWVRT